MISTAENRIVEMVFSDWSIVKTWLEKIGIQITETEEGTQILDSPNHPTKVGFCWQNDDYTTRAVQLGFAIAGVYWVKVFPNLLEKVNTQWKVLSRKNKTKKVNNI